MKPFRLLAIAALALFALSACNTIAGIGKDVKKVGEAVNEAAEDGKRN